MLTVLALGLLIGAVMALTGAGGGILAVPLLVFVLGLGVAQAAPVGLLAVGLAALLGAAIGLRHGVVRYKAAMLMALAGMACAPLGVWSAARLDTRWLSGLFAAVLLFVAFRTFRLTLAPPAAVARPAPPCVLSSETGRFIWTTRCARAMAGTGSVAGLLSGLLGVGGGFVIVPALGRYTTLGMQSIIPTSLAVTSFVTLSGVVSSAWSGKLAWNLAAPFAAGALAGMLAGRRAAPRLAGPQLQRGFAAMAAVVAAGMLYKALA
ncbi:MAG TPA: sulfite exporter TauE/SafE family protein [Burkholderiaceae bacterium]